MSTPYDTDDELLADNGKSWEIRSLNDEFRTAPNLIASAGLDET
jgi:hypothetical protein